MKATEAKEITNSLEIQLETIYELVKEHAKSGLRSLEYTTVSSSVGPLLNHLQDMGYLVSSRKIEGCSGVSRLSIVWS